MTTSVGACGFSSSVRFGGLELASSLDSSLGDDVEVTLVDQAEGFVFGFSKLDVMFGRTGKRADHVVHRYADLAPAGVRSCRRPSG